MSQGFETPKCLGIQPQRRIGGTGIRQGGTCIHLYRKRREAKIIYSLSPWITSGEYMKNLVSVAVDGDGNILTIDSQNHCLYKFTPDGQELAKIGTKGNGPLQFRHPHEIAYNKHNGKIYIVDGYHRCQILNPDLTFVSSFGQIGQDKGQLFNPQGVVCDDNGTVYIVEWTNKRVQSFSPEGKLLKVFEKPEKDEELDFPASITVDKNGRVYVSDYDKHRISVFSTSGKFLASFGQKGEGLIEFHEPTGIQVDDNGILYVCDRRNDRIQAFNTTPTQHTN
jgi:tripartite motif-containing protein 2/3/tripartite motif-containing protein 71